MYVALSRDKLNLFIIQAEMERKLEGCEHEWVDIGPYLVCARCNKRRANPDGRRRGDKEAEV